MEPAALIDDNYGCMSKKYRKLALNILKLAIAVALLSWLVSGLSLKSYVILAASGEKVAVDSASAQADGLFSFELADDGGKMQLRGDEMVAIDSGAPDAVDNYLRPGAGAVLKRISPRPLIIAMVVLGASYLFGAWRWWGLVRSAKLRITAADAVRLTWVGLLFNNIILGTTGGDLAKAYYLSRRGNSRAVSALSVLADRIFGLLSLVILAAGSMAAIIVTAGRDAVSDDFYKRILPAAIVLAVLFAGAVLAAWLLVRLVEGRRIPAFISRLIERFSLTASLDRAVGVIRLYASSFRVIPAAVGRSILMQLFFITAIWQFSCSLGLDIPLGRFFMFVPIIYMIAAVPVTPGAVGVTESLYAGFFADYSSRGEMLILALLVRLAILLWSLPGLAAAMGPNAGMPDPADVSPDTEAN